MRWVADDEPLLSACSTRIVLMTGSETGEVHVIPRSPQGLTTIEITQPVHSSGAVRQVEVAADGRSLLIGYNDGAVLRLDEVQAESAGLDQGDPRNFPQRHVSSLVTGAAVPATPLSGIAFAPDSGQYLRWLRNSGQILSQKMDESNPTIVAKPDASVKSDRNEILCCSPDDTKLAYSVNRRVCVVSVAGNSSECQSIMLPGLVAAMAWHPDGHSLLIGGEFSGLQQWFPASGRLVLLPGVSAQLSQLAVSRQAAIAVSGDRGGRVAVWNLTSGDAGFVAESQIHRGDVKAICLLDQGRLVVSADEYLELVFWKTDTGQRLGCLTNLPGAALIGLDLLAIFADSTERRLTLTKLRVDQSLKSVSWDLAE
jgi:WD40 repeat protein